MSPARLLENWADRVLREQVGLGAAARECVNRGIAPATAAESARDAVQEALAQAARIPDLHQRFGGSYEYFANWVRRVAINCVRSELRRDRRKRPLEKEELLPASDEESAPEVEAVREFLNLLTQEERDLLMLPHEEDLSLDELARRFVPPDDRTENARRLVIWRRQRELHCRFRQWCLDNGLTPGLARPPDNVV